MLKDLNELVNENLISQDTADNILNYYNSRKGSSSNKLLIVFAILGAILIGLGIILLIAHNWDEIPKTVKTILAFVPLIIGQVLCGYTILKKTDSFAWRESTSAFLFLAVGASISLISQIYPIYSDLSTFMLIWVILCLPIIYLLKSGSTLLLYIIGVTYYGTIVGYDIIYSQTESFTYWLLLGFGIPYYLTVLRSETSRSLSHILSWIIPISLTIVLGTISDNYGDLMIPAYISLFGLFYATGNLPYIQNKLNYNNSYLILGIAGTISLLLYLSYDTYWLGLKWEDLNNLGVLLSPEFITLIVISFFVGLLHYVRIKTKTETISSLLDITFLIIIIAFIIGSVTQTGAILINLLVLFIGVQIIRNGVGKNHLGITNFGVLIIASLVISRFFDEEISFLVRGLMFVIVGIGFFAINGMILKKRKKNE